MPNTQFRQYQLAIVLGIGIAFVTLHFATISALQSGTVVIRPGEDFVRTNGAPVTVARTFTISNPKNPATLRVYNGGRNNQYGRVLSAVITLNGTVVLSPTDFNSPVALLTRSVSLAANNVFTVELRSAPGSGLTIEFVGADNGQPGIMASANPPPNAAGWNSTNVTVTFTCTDATSGIASCPAPVTLSMEGANQIITGTATNNAGNSATVSITVNIDKTPPSLSFGLASPLPNGAGWNNTNVSVPFTASDALSGVGSSSASSPLVLSSEGMSVTGSVTISDKAGNTAAFTSTAFNIDKTPPMVQATASPKPNAAGWNNTNVTASFTGFDGFSGISSCSPSLTLSTEGTNQSTSGICTDNAGNVSLPAAVSGINIDKTPPLISITSPTDGATVFASPVVITGNVTDSLSGLTSLTCNAAALGSPIPSPFSCNVPIAAGSNQITAAAADQAGNVASSVISVTLNGGQILITDFNPKSAAAGTLVTLTGSNLAPNPIVTLNKLGGGTISAPVSNAQIESLAFVIPPGADSGPITVSVGSNSAVSGLSLAVTPSSGFTISALPTAASLISGQTVSFGVSLASSDGFAQNAVLGVAGLPSGVDASFKPQSITAGQTSILTLTSPLSEPIGSADLTITASAIIAGIPVSSNATTHVNLVAASTSLIGRTVVDDPLETPLAHVTVTMLGKNGNGGTTACSGSTVSDEAGNFSLSGLGAACVGPQLVGYDGLSATSPPGKYAGVNLVYTLLSGQVTVSPVLVHLPRIDNKEVFSVQQNAAVDQTYAYRSIPGLSVTVYKGTTFTMSDGTTPDPFPLVAVQVPVDRLPDAKPAVPTMINAFIVAFQPANAVASQPAAVYYPNTLNTLPSTTMTMMTLDPTRGRMLPYGTATVSTGGTQIIPDLDPAHPGHRYGIVNFDWHGPMPPPPQQTPDGQNGMNPGPGSGGCGSGGSGDGGPSGGPDGGPDGGPTGGGNGGTGAAGGGCEHQAISCPPCNSPTAGDPIDLSSGLFAMDHTDIALRGGRVSIAVKRFYRTQSTHAGPFGIGTDINYGWRLDAVNPQSATVINLIAPDGNWFPFTRERLLLPLNVVAGTPRAPEEYINYSIPAMQGAVMKVSSTDVTLRWKDGAIYRFVKPSPTFTPLLESITDANGNKILISRNAASPNQISQVSDPVGRSLVFTYDGVNRITSITDPIGRQVRYSYNAQGTLATITDPELGITKYDYDVANRLTIATDARGVVVAQNTYDSVGRVIQQTQADLGIIKFTYFTKDDSNPASPVLATVVTDSLGKTSTYRFNPVGFLTDRENSNGEVRSQVRTAGTNQIERTLVTVNCLSCGETSTTRNSDGDILTFTDELGSTTTYTYDPSFHKITSIKDALGNTTSYTYDAQGNLLTQRDANLNTTSFKYDLFGEVTQITDALNHKTTFSYDTFGNLISTHDPLGNETKFRCDAIGRLVETQDSLGRRSSIAYDRLSRVVSQTDPKGGVTNFSYDAVGNLLAVKDARGKNTIFTYDAMDRMKTHTDPVGKTDIRNYDLNGNLVSFTDRRGQASTFSYDALNRLAGQAYQDGSIVTRLYDTAGRLGSVQESSGPTAQVIIPYNYDLAGRLINAPGQFGTVVYSRDAMGRVKTRQVVGQPAVNYTYDAAGNLIGAAMPQAAVSYGIDAVNRQTSLNRSNGVSTQLDFDPAGRLLGLIHARGATVLNSQVYAYDSSGARISEQTSSAQALITQSASGVYDDANRLIQRGTTNYSYDNNGNLIAETGAAGATTYTWDSRNRLKSVLTPSGQMTSFVYDFSGNLISQNDTGPALNLTRNFVLDEITNVAYQIGSDGTQISILTGQSIDSHLATVATSGQVEYGLTDALNSTVATVDQAGVLRGQFSYEPFGQTTPLGSSFPFQFTGHVPVSSSLYYYRARFYNVEMQRFVSEDPIGLTGGPNFYVYVDNSPLMWTDPTGLINGSFGPPKPAPKTPFPNGNYDPGFSPQDGLCSVPVIGNRMDSNACVLSCCQTHDDCYTQNGCNASSWKGNLQGFNNACQQCNTEVRRCISNAIFR